MGELGLTAAPLPEAVGGAGLLLPRLDAGHGGARGRRHGDGGVVVGPPAVAVPGRHLGIARAARPLAAADARRGGARGVRPDRTARRQRRRRDPDARRTSRSGRRADRLSAERHEDLDLERPRGGPVPRLRDARPERRRQGHHGVPRREGDGRVPVRRPRTKDGDPCLPGRRARLRRRRGAGREPPRRGRGGLQDRPVGARRGPDLDRGRMRRHRPGRAGGGRAIPDGATGVRGAAQRAAGPAVHAGRDGPRGGGGAGA